MRSSPEQEFMNDLASEINSSVGAVEFPLVGLRRVADQMAGRMAAAATEASPDPRLLLGDRDPNEREPALTPSGVAARF
jgi:hypothetical protein